MVVWQRDREIHADLCELTTNKIKNADLDIKFPIEKRYGQSGPLSRGRVRQYDELRDADFAGVYCSWFKPMTLNSYPYELKIKPNLKDFWYISDNWSFWLAISYLTSRSWLNSSHVVQLFAFQIHYVVFYQPSGSTSVRQFPGIESKVQLFHVLWWVIFLLQNYLLFKKYLHCTLTWL